MLNIIITSQMHAYRAHLSKVARTHVQKGKGKLIIIKLKKEVINFYHIFPNNKWALLIFNKLQHYLNVIQSF